MLVLTRKLNEKIRIGDNVTITILRVKGNTVRVGIEAPQDVRVVRGELPLFDDANGETELAESVGDAAQPTLAEELEEAPLAGVVARWKHKDRFRANGSHLALSGAR